MLKRVDKDLVWMLHHPERGFYYSPPATNKTQVWDNAVTWERSQGHRNPKLIVAAMRREGWRARRVELRRPT